MKLESERVRRAEFQEVEWSKHTQLKNSHPTNTMNGYEYECIVSD